MNDDLISRISLKQSIVASLILGGEKTLDQIIDEEPSIDAVKHGVWEIYVISMFDGEGCRCSECGFEGVPYWDFCPNCGARMDGVENG